MPEMPERIALVTGGGTGIGKAIAKALLGAGFVVVIAGRRPDVLEAARVEMGGAGRIVALSCDVASPDSVAALFSAIRTQFGRLDLLVNNAGTGAPGVPLEDVTPEDWQAVVGANLSGAFYCTQQAFRLMKTQMPRGGRIINNGSIAATTPRPRSAPYAATKHAITGLTKATALDGRAFGIACGQIDIGNAATDMSEPMAAGALQADGSIRTEPRFAVEEVGAAVVHMASLPLGTNVLFMTIMATAMPFVGRG